MVVEVVFGAVLVLLGFCALLGLPTIALRLELRAERSHALDARGVATDQAAGNAAHSNVTFH